MCEFRVCVRAGVRVCVCARDVNTEQTCMNDLVVASFDLLPGRVVQPCDPHPRVDAHCCDLWGRIDPLCPQLAHGTNPILARHRAPKLVRLMPRLQTHLQPPDRPATGSLLQVFPPDQSHCRQPRWGTRGWARQRI